MLRKLRGHPQGAHSFNFSRHFSRSSCVSILTYGMSQTTAPRLVPKIDCDVLSASPQTT